MPRPLVWPSGQPLVSPGAAMTLLCACCGRDCTSWAVTSPFDFEFVCLECHNIELAHHLYRRAEAAAMTAFSQGKVRFRGLGRPAELCLGTE